MLQEMAELEARRERVKLNVARMCFQIHSLQATYPCVLASQEIFVRFYLFGVASISLKMLIVFSFAFSSSQERRGGEES